MSGYFDVSETGFEYEQMEEKEDGGGKEGIVFFGQKGSGKTSGAFMLPGTKFVLSFDRKSLRAKNTMRPEDKTIEVFDAVKYVSHLKNKVTESAAKNFEYVLFLLEECRKRGGVDWVVIDGLDILIEMCEMKMRYDNKLGPFQAFATLGLWKDRKLNIRAIHETAYSVASKGVVWTTYADKDEIVNNATLVRRTDVPKWMDIVMYDTDAVIKTVVEHKEGKARFRLEVISSKIARFKTGDIIDVTDKLSLDEGSPAGKLEEVPDLTKAVRRKKARSSIQRKGCPECGAEVVNELGVVHCSKCEWVHDDESD